MVEAQTRHLIQPRDQGELPKGGDTLSKTERMKRPLSALFSAVLDPRQLSHQFFSASRSSFNT